VTLVSPVVIPVWRLGQDRDPKRRHLPVNPQTNAITGSRVFAARRPGQQNGVSAPFGTSSIGGLDSSRFRRFQPAFCVFGYTGPELQSQFRIGSIAVKGSLLDALEDRTHAEKGKGEVKAETRNAGQPHARAIGVDEGLIPGNTQHRPVDPCETPPLISRRPLPLHDQGGKVREGMADCRKFPVQNGHTLGAIFGKKKIVDTIVTVNQSPLAVVVRYVFVEPEREIVPEGEPAAPVPQEG